MAVGCRGASGCHGHDCSAAYHLSRPSSSPWSHFLPLFRVWEFRVYPICHACDCLIGHRDGVVHPILLVRRRLVFLPLVENDHDELYRCFHHGCRSFKELDKGPYPQVSDYFFEGESGVHVQDQSY